MSRLIVLSNRVSLPQSQQAGGLAVAMHGALSKVGGVWLGWNAAQVDQANEQHFDILYKAKITYLTSPLTREQYAGYYCGFSNNTLWSAMHERDDLMEYDSQQFETYQEVNQLFAKKIAEFVEPDDVIWVQDYHFFSVARYCRELGLTNKIGFFLHIPFASMAIWNKLPCSETLLEDLCQYDLVGLQTKQDQKRCIQACTQLLKAQRLSDNVLSLRQKTVVIQDYPIGVDVKTIQAGLDQAEPETSELNKDEMPVKTIIGVDRIDYSKGLFERLNAFADFLELHPDLHQHVQHQQIACPSRLDVATYRRLYERFKLKVSLINEEFSQETWEPIDCCYESKAHSELMQMYRHANVCWVSSLKDGMNLVAKEFIAAQDPEDPGVLILSKFAGAAEQMQHALIVDPTDRTAMIEALETALAMPREERIYRYQQLIKLLTAYDINAWRDDFLYDLDHSQDMLHNYIPTLAYPATVSPS